jgi:hypothetical protein
MGLAFLVGGTEADIEGLQRRIKGIYDIRSKVVHHVSSQGRHQSRRNPATETLAPDCFIRNRR